MRPHSFEDFISANADGVFDWSSFDARASLPGKLITRNSTILDGPTVGATLPGSLDDTEALGDVYVFHLTKGVTYTFAELSAASGGIIDPFLILFNPDGSLNSFDDDGGGGRSSLLTFTPKKDGDYFVVAGSWVNIFDTGGDTGNYELKVWTNSTTPDAGATLGTASSLTIGQTIYGQVGAPQDVDVFKFSATAGTYYQFNFSGGVGAASEQGESGSVIANVEILNGAGQVVASGVNLESGAWFVADQAGDYYVRLTSADGSSGGYELNSTSAVLSEKDPLESILWDSANNVTFVDTNNDGVGDTAYIYFAKPGENFGEIQSDDGADGIPNSGDEGLISLGWNDHEKAAVFDALGYYENILNVHFVETMDASLATFRLITTTDEDAYGARFYPQDEDAYGTQMGIGTFNVDSGGWAAFPQSLDEGGYAYSVILHEFGHALGLSHPHDTGGGSEIMLGVFASQGSYGVYNLDQGVYTAMSYNDGWVFHPDGPSAFTIAGIDNGWATIGAFDIAALQQRYADLDPGSTVDGKLIVPRNTGNDTYTLTDVTNDSWYQTIWDTGGNDTIAYNGNLNAQIDLTAATLDYSPTGGGVVSFLYNPPGVQNSARVRGGFTIANGVVIENATGGNGNDVLLGNSSDNVLTGNGGNDILMGRGGNDSLVGGAGSDTAAYNDAASSVTINLVAHTATGGDGSDTLDSIENATGSAFNDMIIGDGGNNVLDGGDGNDMIIGNGGTDTVSYASVSAGVTVDLRLAAQNTGGGGFDTLSGFANLTGSRFNDRLIGDGNANVIKGGDGLDTVTLGGGNDTFVAEIGASKMGLKTGTMSVDIVTDFVHGSDKIDLSNLGAFGFRGTASSSQAGDLTYKVYTSLNGAENALGIDLHSQPGANVSGPVTVVYGNTDGGDADFAIILLNHNGVSSTDFIYHG